MELILKDGSKAKDGPLVSDMLSPENLHIVPFTEGDLFRELKVFPKIPWLEAICNVTPQVSVKANSIWAGFGEGIWPNDWWAKGMNVKVNKDWLNLLIESTKYCVEKFSNNFVIAQTDIMRGPVDIMAALVGDKNVIVGMYRHPKETKKLLNELADICIMVSRTQNDLIPSFRGGYVNTFGIWAPGKVTRMQEDGAAYLSPALYKEFLQPVDRKIAKAFDYPAIHLHLDAIADIEQMGAIQYGLGEPPPYGPPIKERLPTLKRVIRKKPLICSASSREQVDMLLKELPPQGLCLSARIQEAGNPYG
jgi:hypothetical protein